MEDFSSYYRSRPSTSSSQHVPKYPCIHRPNNSSSSLYHFTYPTFDPSSPVPSIRHTRRSITMTRPTPDFDFQAALATAALPPDHPHARKIKLPTPVRDDEAGRSTRSLTRRKSFIQKLKAKISRKDLRSAAEYDEDAKSIPNSKFLREIRRETSSLYSHNPSTDNLNAYRPITPILPMTPTRRTSHKRSPSTTNIAYTPIQATTPTRTFSHKRTHNAYTSTKPSSIQPLSLRRSVSAHVHPSATLDGSSAPPSPPLKPTRVRRQALLPTNGDDQLMALAIEKHERQKALFRSASKHGIATGGTTPSPSQRPRASTVGTMGTASSFKSGIAPGEFGQSKGDVDVSAETGGEEEKRSSKIFSDSQAWTVFASHTRGERCGSAGKKDAMSARDFAVEAARKMEAGTRETGAAGERRVRSGTAPQGEVFGPQRPPEAVKNRAAEGEEEEPPRTAKLPAFLFPLQKRRSVSSKRPTTTHSKSKSTSDADVGFDTRTKSAPAAKQPTHTPSKSKSFLTPPPALTRFTRYYTSLLTTSTTFRGTNRRTSVSAATGALAHPELEMLSVAPTEAQTTAGATGIGKFLKEVDERLDKEEEERTDSAWGVGVDLGTIGGEIGSWSGRGGSVFEVKRPGTGESGVFGWGGLRGLVKRSEDDSGDDGDEEDEEEDEPPGVAEAVEFGVGEVKHVGVGLGQLDGAEEDEERGLSLGGRKERGKERGAEYHAR
ncbi:unnamed protein product [Zymoseptoria tritici ST99CH_1E4]|uniref:Uncharacterized protein n=1 Tax=Zymoseptoria tritici ST99CH_1E4 TaxID=1276532 RepID=A0A2H1H5F7_ZYMTR|nr:unnamed protein product [Zymoseptoria tritici ST99CH_1E4]